MLDHISKYMSINIIFDLTLVFKHSYMSLVMFGIQSSRNKKSLKDCFFLESYDPKCGILKKNQQLNDCCFFTGSKSSTCEASFIGLSYIHHPKIPTLIRLYFLEVRCWELMNWHV